MSASDLHRLHGKVDRICVSEIAVADQMSGTDPANHVPDLAPAFVVVALAAPTTVLPVQRTRDALPSAHTSPFLLFHRLQL